ncbi:unnamed protein product [Coregonus sp. 'balchen']|nr:unnamed protein product [Coregonus sp. 'balchen']
MTAYVGGFFEAGTLVRYNFLSETAAANQDTRFLAQPLTPQEVNLTREEVAFSFSTSNTPAILLYVSSKTQDYLALLDHYPPVSYSLPEASDTQFNLVKTLFLGKVFGEYRHLKCVFDPSAWPWQRQ